MENKTPINFEEMIACTATVRERMKKSKKPAKSLKSLSFDEDLDNDSDLKTAIIRKINGSHLTYSDLYAYCTKVKGGDISEGQKFACNIISGLKHRPTMIDTRVSLLCDFLSCDLLIRERKKIEPTKAAISLEDADAEDEKID